MGDLDETQLDDEEAEAYLIRRADERDRDKVDKRKLWEKIRGFRWSGGIG